MSRGGRVVIFGALGLLLGAALCAVLLVVDGTPAGAQTTTTEPTTTTTEPTTTTTTAPTTTTTEATTTTTEPPSPQPEPVDLEHPIGSREAAQWLACLLAFTLGHLVTR